jgi:ABC-type antimicrobial peptide transport system permease subunit
MIFYTNLSIAFEALKSSRTRTYLTMLGIIIGIAAITFILALGDSIKSAISSQVRALDNSIIIVRPGSQQKGIFSEKGVLNYSPLSSYAATTLTERDVATLKESPSIQAVAPFMLINGLVKGNKAESNEATILATSPDLQSSLKLDMTEGQFIDAETNRETVVIGNQLAIDLFGTDRPIGERLKIRGQDHTVIGILRPNNGPIGINGVNLNYAAIISLEEGKSFNQGIAQIQQIAVTPKKNVSLQNASREIETVLLKNHNNERDFTVASGQEAANISKSFYEFITTLTAIIASISIIVGGVGIMNIMLVGVAERTREVGIRKSMGASNRHILWQFLIEALMMSCAGGLIGVIVGYIGASITAFVLGFLPVFTFLTFAIAFGISVLVGVIFGLMPALRAAHKDPIEALREHG